VTKESPVITQMPSRTSTQHTNKPSPKRAVVLLSGGLDSSTTLYYALAEGWKCLALTFNYGQRHARERKSAFMIARSAKVPICELKIQFPWKGSSLLDRRRAIPKHRADFIGNNIPNTYVPARNTVFLSFALSYAETQHASGIFIGANYIDFSGYPDCRPDYFDAMQKVARLGTKTGRQGHAIKIYTPLLRLNKAQIIRLALRLKVPLELTWSCYNGRSKPCGHCDACILRQRGFEKVGIRDPLLARSGCKP